MRDALLSQIDPIWHRRPGGLYVETPSESSFVEVLRRLRVDAARDASLSAEERTSSYRTGDSTGPCCG